MKHLISIGFLFFFRAQGLIFKVPFLCFGGVVEDGLFDFQGMIRSHSRSEEEVDEVANPGEKNRGDKMQTEASI